MTKDERKDIGEFAVKVWLSGLILTLVGGIIWKGFGFALLVVGLCLVTLSTLYVTVDELRDKLEETDEQTRDDHGRCGRCGSRRHAQDSCVGI